MATEILETQKIISSEDKSKLMNYLIIKIIIDDAKSTLDVYLNSVHNVNGFTKRLDLHYETAGLDNTSKCQFKHVLTDDPLKIQLIKTRKAQDIKPALDYIHALGMISNVTYEKAAAIFTSPQNTTQKSFSMSPSN